MAFLSHLLDEIHEWLNKQEEKPEVTPHFTNYHFKLSKRIQDSHQFEEESKAIKKWYSFL